MLITGGCHCGAIRYEAEGEAHTHALCHCTDCRRSAGAPMVAWASIRRPRVKMRRPHPGLRVVGTRPAAFCEVCGTGLFYTNEAVLPGLIDVQSATYDDPDELQPQAHIQTAERIGWMATAHEFPAFERYPPQS